MHKTVLGLYIWTFILTIFITLTFSSFAKMMAGLSELKSWYCIKAIKVQTAERNKAAMLIPKEILLCVE